MTVMTPSVLIDKLASEIVPVYLQLGPLVGSDTITSVSFSSDPTGLTFASQSILDSGQTAAALVGGGVPTTRYILSAVCTMTSGQIYTPVVALPVVTAYSETNAKRPVVL